MLCPGLRRPARALGARAVRRPAAAPKLAQGFTTEVICPDGLAPAPVARPWRERRDYLRALEGNGPADWAWTTFAEYLDALDATRPATRSCRRSATARCATSSSAADGGRPRELRVRREVRLGIEAGARMLSFGLVYLPGAYAATEELVAVAEEAAAFGAPLVPHVRNEGAGLLEAVGEMIDVARARARRSTSRT